MTTPTVASNHLLALVDVVNDWGITYTTSFAVGYITLTPSKFWGMAGTNSVTQNVKIRIVDTNTDTNLTFECYLTHSNGIEVNCLIESATLDNDNTPTIFTPLVIGLRNLTAVVEALHIEEALSLSANELFVSLVTFAQLHCRSIDTLSEIVVEEHTDTHYKVSVRVSDVEVYTLLSRDK